MAITFLQQAQELIDELPFAKTLTDVTGNSTEIQRAVDLLSKADYQVQNQYQDWHFLWRQHPGTTTVDGVQVITPASDAAEFDRDSFALDRTSDNYKKLLWLDYKRWRETYNLGNRDNTVPDYFSITPENNIILEPPPAGGLLLTYDYWIAPIRLVLKTDISIIPDQYRRVAIARAKVWWANQEEDTAVAQDAATEFDIIFGKLKASQLPGQERNTRADGELSAQVPIW